MVTRCAVLAIVVAGLLGACSGDEAEAVALVPAAKAGADPFTDSVAVGPVASLPGNVEAVSAQVRDGLKADVATGGLRAAGSTPGLYGGSGDAKACDPDKLVAYLGEHPDKAKAWAGVIGIRSSGIESFVRSLAPVVLTSDTLVVNHGFRDGEATAKRSVLQAGTAVLVDQQGTPRVKCNCGNPLGRAAEGDLGDAKAEGTAWASYSPAEVVLVVPADTGGTLHLTDIDTGESIEAPVGSGSTEPEPPAAEEIPAMSWAYATDDENGSSSYGTEGTISGAIISDLAEDVAAALPPDDERLHGFDAVLVTANAPDGEGRQYGGQDGLNVDDFGTFGFRVEAEMSTPDPSPTEFGRTLAVGSEGSGASSRPVLAYLPAAIDGEQAWQRAEVPGAEGKAGSVGALTYGDGKAWAVAAYQTDGGGDARDLAILSSADGVTWEQVGPLLRAGGATVALAYTDGALVLGAVPAADGGGNRITEPITIAPGTDQAEPIAGTPFEDEPVVDLDGPDGGVGNGLVAGAGKDVFISGSGRTWKKVETAPHPITAVEGRIDPTGTVTTAPGATATTAPSTTVPVTTTPASAGGSHPCDVGHIIGFEVPEGEGLEFMDCVGDFAAAGTYVLADGTAMPPGFLKWNDARSGWEIVPPSTTSPYCTGTAVPEKLRGYACGAG